MDYTLIFRRSIYFVVAILVFQACKSGFKGDMVPNQAPETHTVVDTILRSGNNRLTSSIEVKWWGTDPDGYISGYEISADQVNWTFTQSQDTAFVVNLPAGSDTFNFRLYIRAVDNEGLKDPSPAAITYPVKNSKPTVRFQYSAAVGGTPSRNPQISYPATRWNWVAADPDGPNNLSHVELIWNDTTKTPTSLDAVYSSAVLEGIDWTASVTDTRVYRGNLTTPSTDIVPGLKLNDSNVLYIRAVDQVGAASAWVPSYKLFIKKPVSKNILVNANSSRVQQAESFYLSNLSAAGINIIDVTRVNEVVSNNYTQLAPDNFTQSLIFKHFSGIIWFGNVSDFTLSLAQKTTELFLNNGGKLFIATNFSSSVDEQAGFLEFTPIDSLVNPPKGSQFRLNNGAVITPTQSGWPTLKSEKIVSSARPFNERPGAVALYSAEITKSSSSSSEIWTGKSVVMAKQNGTDGKAKFIISSLELDNLNGNSNMADLFQKIFADELGFK